jgi:hypothetical protein
MSMEYFNDTTGNQTRDLPACSAVPQPTYYRTKAQSSVSALQSTTISVPNYIRFTIYLQTVPVHLPRGPSTLPLGPGLSDGHIVPDYNPN